MLVPIMAFRSVLVPLVLELLVLSLLPGFLISRPRRQAPLRAREVGGEQRREIPELGLEVLLSPPEVSGEVLDLNLKLRPADLHKCLLEKK